VYQQNSVQNGRRKTRYKTLFVIIVGNCSY